MTELLGKKCIRRPKEKKIR